MLRAKLRNFLQEILNETAKNNNFLPSDIVFIVERPRKREHGDFSSDLAFKLSKVLRKAPLKIAEELLPLLKKNCPDDIEDITVLPPGFINFLFKKKAWQNILSEVYNKKNDFGKSDFGGGEKVILEYVSANPTGPLTIAHGRQAAIGDTLSNIMQTTGYEVCREYYLNDAGRQINTLGKSVMMRFFELCGKNSDFPEDGYKGSYIIDIARLILSEKGSDFVDSEECNEKFFADYAKKFLMQTIKDDLLSIKVTFDNYFSELSLHGRSVENALNVLKEKGYLKEEDGAIWFKSTELGDDKDRVLKKRDGSYTYLVPDIAYHKSKFDRGYEYIIDLLGPDHHGYIGRLKAACAALGYNSDKLKVLIIQLTTLYRNGEPYKMSTRAGDFVSLKQLIDEVGCDAARFFFLMRKTSSLLDFDLELAKERSQNNPVFYLQYAHARISGIKRLADIDICLDNVKLELLTTTEEMELMKIIHEYPFILTQSALSLEPYRIVEYLNELAASFHKFYAKHKVINEDIIITTTRLFLCECVGIVMNNGLNILGVSAPERM